MIRITEQKRFLVKLGIKIVFSLEKKEEKSQ